MRLFHTVQRASIRPPSPRNRGVARPPIMTQRPPSARTDRADFLATSDPAVLESADRGEIHLLSYRQLYELWERQHWAVQEIDFTQDRLDWEAFDDEERTARMYAYSSFLGGEERVTAELGPIMWAVPTDDMRVFLSTQIADEARHVKFFERYAAEIGMLDADGLTGRLEETEVHRKPEFGQLFDEMLHSRVQRLAAEPEDRDALVEAITIYHIVIEGMLALTGQHFMIIYNEDVGTMPGYIDGLTNVARDEHRHLAFGVSFLRDMVRADPRYKEVITNIVAQVAPVAAVILRPPWFAPGEDDVELFGRPAGESRAFALKSLERRMKVIGVA
jgi:ribonucleoside-diphosphate reductase beta chain